MVLIKTDVGIYQDFFWADRVWSDQDTTDQDPERSESCQIRIRSNPRIRKTESGQIRIPSDKDPGRSGYGLALTDLKE